MNIAFLAPTEQSFISQFLPVQDFNELPMGYYGAPFIGTVIAELLHQNHQVRRLQLTNDVVNYRVMSAGKF